MITVALFSAATVKAQSVKFGLKGGLNMAKVSSFTYYGSNGSTLEKVQTEFKPGFHAGGRPDGARPSAGPSCDGCLPSSRG